MFSAYHIILYILLLLSAVVKKKSVNHIFMICSASLVFFCTLRNPSLYNDLVGYEEFFRTGQISSTLEGSFNFGYILLNNSIKNLFGSFTILLCVVATIIITCYCFFIKKYSPYPLLSLALYFMVGFIFSLSGLRQALSVAMGLFFFHYVIKEDFNKSMIWLLASLSIHTTAIVLLPVWFIYKIPITKINVILMAVVTVGVTVLLKTIGALFLGLSDYYMKYIDMEAEGSIQRTLMKAFIFLVFVYALRAKIFEKGINFILLICLVMNIVIYAGGTGFYGLFRLRMYFEISEIIGVPVILYYVNNVAKRRRFITYLGIFVYMLLLFMSFDRSINTDSIMTTPEYSTIFTSNTSL